MPSLAEPTGDDRAEGENGKRDVETGEGTEEGTATRATTGTHRSTMGADTSVGAPGGPSSSPRRQGSSAAPGSSTGTTGLSSKHRGRVLSGILRQERLSTTHVAAAEEEGTERVVDEAVVVARPSSRRSGAKDSAAAAATAAATLKSGWGRRSRLARPSSGEMNALGQEPPPSATTTATATPTATSGSTVYNVLSASEADEQGRHALSGVAVSASRNEWVGTSNGGASPAQTTSAGWSGDGKASIQKSNRKDSPAPPNLTIQGRYRGPTADAQRPGAVRIYPGGPVAEVAGRILDDANDGTVTEDGSEPSSHHTPTRTAATSSSNYPTRERHGLVEASLVVAEDDHDDDSDLGYNPDAMDLDQALRTGEVVRAQPVETRRWPASRVGGVTAIVVGVAVALAVALSTTLPSASTKAQASAGADRPPTSAPTLSAISAEFQESLPTATLATIHKSESSPQGRALRWVVSHSPVLELQGHDPVARMTQVFALATLFYATGGDSSWVDKDGWLNVSASVPSSSPYMNECSWYGCSCDTSVDSEPPVLNAVRLLENNLVGPLPPEISLLSNLQVLDLSSNGLSGTIPKELSNLSRLEHLDLELNVMQSEIPPELGALSRLTSLNLGSSYLTGTIPTNLGQLSALSELNLGGNGDLGGTIPSELGGLVSLAYFLVSSTAIRGSVPTHVGQLGALKRLELFGSRIGGSIPLEIGRLTNLEALDLSDTGITGDIPSTIGMLSSLQFLNLANCALEGSVPSEVFGALRLSDLRLCNNSFTGSLPSEIGRPSLLRVAKLHSNAFRGTLPTDLGKLASLLRLEVFSNNLSGAVPTELCDRISAGLVLVMDCDRVTCSCDCNKDNCAVFEG
jgi:Leucine Rich Repeat